ncbi:NYN domain-containing protein [Rhizobium sp. RCAM05350]|nr:NYN domain-containing protein [Rhizobium sp. RCAM05350]
MPLYYSTPSGSSPTIYMFVDAASLYAHTAKISRQFFNGTQFEFDLKRMRMPYTRLFYYDAMPVRKVFENEDEATYLSRTEPQRKILDIMKATDGVHVYEGDAHQRKRGQGGLEQKKVDVMIAVDMLTHTFRHNMHQAELLTGDNDFKPLIDALVREGMLTTLWYPPGSTNPELINAADSRRPISLQILWQWMTDASRQEFTIPMQINKDPSLEPGDLLVEWTEGGEQFALRKDFDDYLVLKNGDDLNRLNIRHSNYELLNQFCLELGYHLPTNTG